MIAAAGMLAMTLPALADAPAPVTRDAEMVRSFTQRIAALQKRDSGQGDRMAALNHALAHYIDFGQAARNALGGYWSRMEPATHERLIDTLRQHVAKRLSLFLFDGTAHPIEVGRASDGANGSPTVVPATLALAPGSSIPLDFMMADRTADKPRIVDVMIAGVSLMGMLGDECRAVVQRQGVDALIARLAQ